MLTFLLIISSIPAPMARLLSDSSTDLLVMKSLVFDGRAHEKR